MFHYKLNSRILKEMDGLVYGHRTVKKMLINLVNRSRLRYYQKWGLFVPEHELIDVHKVLILGPSGTGKTHLIESLAQLVSFPLVKLDATNLNPTGASGGVTSEDVKKLIRMKAQLFVEQQKEKGYIVSLDGAIDQTVVFIDEIDKLGMKFESSGNWNRHTQSNFLTLIDNKDKFKGVSFVFAGAFTSLFESKENNKTIGNMGFYPSEVKKLEKDIADEVIESGLITELVGRLTAITPLDIFDENDYYTILKTIVLPKKIQLLSAYDITFPDFSEDELKEIAKKACNSQQGVRFLNRQLEARFNELEFHYEESSPFNKLPILGEEY